MCAEKLMVPNRWSINVEAKKKKKNQGNQKTVPSSYDSVVDSSYWVHDRHILVTIFTSLIFGNLECINIYTYFFNFILFLNFTILYWFCQILLTH